VLTKADLAARSGNGDPTDIYNNGGEAMSSDSHSSNAPDATRRRILAALAGSVALSACGGGGGGGSSGSTGSTNGIPPDRASLPRPVSAPATSGIDHIVLVTMENRSFDHILGWVPNAEHQQARQFTDAFGQTQSSFALTSNAAYGFQACSFSDPNHLYSARILPTAR
jgi:phospholipase C